MGNPNYTFSDSAVLVRDYVIKKATLTLTAKDISVTYGDPIKKEQYGFTDSGIINNDLVQDTIDGVLNGVTLEYLAGVDGGKEYAAGDPVKGEYIVTIKGFDLPNYTVEPKAGTLTVNKRALTVTITAPDQTYTGNRLEPTISLGNLRSEISLNRATRAGRKNSTQPPIQRAARSPNPSTPASIPSMWR